MFILIRTGSWSTSLMDGSPALLIRSMAMLLRLTNSSSRRSSWPGKNTFTKVHGIFILFRQTLVTAVAFTFAVTAGQVRAENSFSTVVIDPGHVSTENRGIRSADYYVLRKCRLPAVLVECGFLTNPREAQVALTTAYREQIAEQIAAGIIEQRQFAFPPLAPTHRSGRLVHKNKKHRKIVDLERFGKDRRASRTSLMDGSAALLIRSMVIKRQKSRAAATKLLLAAPSMQGAA